MTVLGTTNLTLADWAKRQDPDGGTPIIVDLLSQSNEWLSDMSWIEGNQTSGHKTTVRTGLPEGTWRMLYQGISPTKSTTAQIVENCGNLEGVSRIDKDLADLNGNSAQFRMGEDAAFIEGMSQQFSSALAYSNSLQTPAQFMGFAPRYNTLSTAAAVSANIIDAGGTGSTNTSIWFVGWGPNTVTGIFPKGKMAGLQMLDKGEVVYYPGDGKQYQTYQSLFKWECGLCVRDWRYVVRICNIDVDLLDATTAPNLANLLVMAANKFPTAPAGLSAVQSAERPSGVVGPARFAIYCNRTVRTALELQLLNKPSGSNTNIYLTSAEWDGKVISLFRGVPIRTVDSLLNTETRVT
jgi:hypothetical protein